MICALALALAGCGDSEERGRTAAPPTVKGDWGPSEPGSGERARPVAPPRKAPSPTVASLLDAGAVGVVGVEGVVGVRPASLDVSADGTIDDLRWQRWDSGRAMGTGKLVESVAYPVDVQRLAIELVQAADPWTCRWCREQIARSPCPMCGHRGRPPRRRAAAPSVAHQGDQHGART